MNEEEIYSIGLLIIGVAIGIISIIYNQTLLLYTSMSLLSFSLVLRLVVIYDKVISYLEKYHIIECSRGKYTITERRKTK